MAKNIGFKDLYVMLVEPSSTQFRVIYDYLSEIGVTHIVNQTTAADALSEMKKRLPDLVVSALYLPDMTGTQLVESMRADSELQDIAFMLISSETSVRYLEPIRQAGVIAILPKPFEISQLKKALFTTIDFIEPVNVELGDRYAEDLEVLVVDDSNTARHHIIKTLKGMGIEKIVEAVNGNEAIDIMGRQYFDLVVTDYNMPEMDGKAFISHVRGNSGQSAVPILMVTSECDESRLAAIEQVGVSAICNKPFEIATIRSIIQNMVN